MPKGQITQYDGGRFASQAVGVPQQDQSGQILGQGISNLGQALQRRAEATADITALTRFTDFRVKYETGKENLFRQLRDQPLEYPKAVKDMAGKLVEEYSKDMDSLVAKKFKSYTANALMQDADNLVNQAFQRDNEIQITNAFDTYQNQALQGASVSSAKDLQQVLTGFEFIDQKVGQIIDAKANQKLKTDARQLAVENAMYSQIMTTPSKVLRELTGGAYAGVLTPEEISQYATRARTALLNRAEDDLYRNMYQAQGKLLDFQQRVDSREITVAELIAERQAAVAMKDQKDANGELVVKPAYLRGLDILIDQMTYSKMKLPANAETRKTVLSKFDTDWETYLSQPGKQPNKEDIEKELELYAGLSDLYKNGVISKADFDEKVGVMRTKLALRKGQVARVQSFDEAIDQAGTVQASFAKIPLWWRESGNDVVSRGYGLVKDFVDKAYANTDEDTRRELKAQMLSKYHQVILNTPEEVLKGMTTDADRDSFARRAIYGVTGSNGAYTPGILAQNMTYLEPVSGRRLYVGDTVTEGGIPKRFSGLSLETQKPIWVLSDEAKGMLIRRGNTSWQPIGINENGQIIFREVK